MVEWLSGWSYRKKHEINGSSAGAVTDYQIRVKVHYGSGTDSGEDVYLNEKCRSDFGDVRFTKDDGETLLYYWMEEKVDGDYAIFWVKVPSIPADPDKATIYIYYGKSDATYAGSGDDTFEFFDDFEGTSVDTSKWQYDTGSFTVSNSVARCTSSSKQIRSFDTFDDVEVRVKWRATSGARGNICFRKSYDSASAQRVKDPGYDVSFRIPNSDELLRKWPGGNAASVILDSASYNYTANTWYIGFIRGYGSSLSGKTTDDATLLSDSDTAHSSGEVGIGTNLLESPGTDYAEFDWILVRKYIDPEPSHGTWYAEEQAAVTFSGKVQLPDGTPVANATIIAIDEETNEILATTTSASDGTWSMEIPYGKTVTIVAIPQESDYGGDAKAHIQAS